MSMLQFIYLKPILLFPSPLSSSISPYDENKQSFTTYFFRHLFYLRIYVIHHPSLAPFSLKFFSIFFSRFYCFANIISINHIVASFSYFTLNYNFSLFVSSLPGNLPSLFSSFSVTLSLSSSATFLSFFHFHLLNVYRFNYSFNLCFFI